MKNKNVIITGATGQLAQEIKYLSQDLKNFNFFFYSRDELDITKRQQVKKIFSEVNPDFIINTAAYTKVDLAETHKTEAYEINAYGLQNIIQESKKARIIHISTDYVYHSLSDTPLKESSPTTPKSKYARSKLLGEKFITNSDCKYIILRTSWVYGAKGNNFVRTILRLAKEKEELNIIDDQIGAPTYALDLASTILKIVEGTAFYRIHDNQWSQIYNYTNAGKISWYNFAKQIVESSNSSVKIYPIKTYEYRVAAKRPAWSVMDLNKISQLHGIDIYDWKERLEHCLSRIIN